MNRTSLIIISLITLFLISACNTKPKPQTPNAFTSLPDSLKIDSITELIRDNPRQSQLYDERSKLNTKLGRITDAINDLTIASALDSLNPQYYIDLSDYFLRMGKSEVTHDLLLKANRLIPANKDILYRLGNLYFYVRNYKKAMEYLNQAMKIDPFMSEVYFSKAMIFKETGDTTKAVENLQIAVEREPRYYDAYMLLGYLFSAKSDSLAIDYYRNAARIIPDSYETYYSIAMFYQENGKPGEALKTYRFMLDSISNRLPIIHYNMGYIEMLYYENFGDAIQHYDSAIMFKAIYPEAFCNRAFCYEKLSQLDQARADFTKALEQLTNMDIAIKGLNRLDGKKE